MRSTSAAAGAAAHSSKTVATSFAELLKVMSKASSAVQRALHLVLKQVVSRSTQLEQPRRWRETLLCRGRLRHREDLVSHVPMPMKRLGVADREAGKLTLEHTDQKISRRLISGVRMHAKVWHGDRKRRQRAPPNGKDADAMNT